MVENTMQFSREFFMQRSFEVVWASFRVGEFVRRQDLRELLERRALGYMSSKTTESLDELDEVIKLGMQIGEIKDINGRVLLRETGNLRAALREWSHAEETQKNLAEGSIEEIFKKRELNFPVNDKESKNSVSDNSPIGGDYEEKSENVGSAKDESNSGNNPAKNMTELKESGNNPAKSGKRPALFENSDSYRRKKVILELLQSRTMCGIKDIVAVLPDSSERTLRYDVQQLVERKLVERVGKGGPQSFLKLRSQSH